MVGFGEKYRAKRAILWALAHVMIMMKACGFRPPDKKDSFRNERSEIVGHMFGSFLRRSLVDFRKRIDNNLTVYQNSPKKTSLQLVFDPIMTNKLEQAMITGVWAPDSKTAGNSRRDACMQLKQFNPIGRAGHVGRSNSANTSQRKSNTSKQVDPHSFAYQDPAETPEGAQCGVVHHKSCCSSVTAGSSKRILIAIIWYMLGPDVLTPIDSSLFRGVHEHIPHLTLRVRDNPDWLPVNTMILESNPPDVNQTEAFIARKRKKTEAQVRAAQKTHQKRIKLGLEKAARVIPAAEKTARATSAAEKAEKSARATSAVEKAGRATSAAEKQQKAPAVIEVPPPHASPAAIDVEKHRLYEYRPPTRARVIQQPWYFVYVNGSIEWKTQCPEKVLKVVRHLRQTLAIDTYTSVHGEDYDIFIRTDVGRNVRPLINLRRWMQAMRKQPKLRQNYSWMFKWCWKQGIVEFVDPEEEPSTVIAFGLEDFVRRVKLGERFTHMEPDPRLMFSFVTLLCPFLHHNQGARAVLHDATIKQTYMNATNHLEQNLAQYCLHVAHMSPCSTAPRRDYHFADVSGAQIVNQLFWNHRQNEEDADVYDDMAQDFLLFDSSKTRTAVTGSRISKGTTTAAATALVAKDKGTSAKTLKYSSVATAGSAQDAGGSVLATFGNPMTERVRTTTLRPSCYDHLQEDGMPMIGQYMQPGHVAVGRTYQIGSTVDGSTEKFDDSLIVKRGEDGFVISTMAIQNENGTAAIRKVVMKTKTRGRLADKYASAHGQKGVSGLQCARHHLPFSLRDLVTPERVSNISGQTGRLSEGHQKELYETTVCVRAGKFIDATVGDNALKRLERQQVRKYATETAKASLFTRAGYVHPETGELMEPMYYGNLPVYKLKHLASDKHHERSEGPIQLLTHQPTEGRARDGGHRVGIMESSNFDACGVSAISNQRLKTDSDGRIVDYCQQCTQMAVRNSTLGLAWCQQCFTGDFVISIRGPHAHMLCQQEWFCMGYAQYMTFVDEKVPVSYIPQEGVVDRSKPFPQSEWAKLMQMPRLQPYEHRRLGTTVPDTIHSFLRNLPSIHRPFAPQESRFRPHMPKPEFVKANEVEQVRISAADAGALLAGEVPKTARGRSLVGPEYVIEASVINYTRPPPHVVAWYHNRIKSGGGAAGGEKANGGVPEAKKSSVGGKNIKPSSAKIEKTTPTVLPKQEPIPQPPPSSRPSEDMDVRMPASLRTSVKRKAHQR